MDADQTRVPYSGAYLPPEIVQAIQGEHYPADAVAKAWPLIAALAWDEGYAKGNLDGYWGTRDEKNPYRAITGALTTEEATP